MKRTTADGTIRQVAMKTINCKICGDEQQVQVGSVCHGDNLCILCANHKIKSRQKDNKYKNFEVQ